MSDDVQTLVVGSGQGTTVQGPAGGPLTFKARSEQTGGRLTVLENVVAPGEGPPVHVHEAQDEAWWILDGSFDFRLGDERADVEAGAFVFVPRGTPHAFRNAGEAPARILVWFTPAGMEPFFDRFAALAPGEAGPQAFRELGAPVGMEVVAPPLGAA